MTNRREIQRRAAAAKTAPRWRQRTGEATEALACRFLEGHGCILVARRFRCREGEIDIVVRDRDVVAFVEVKARRGVRYGSGLEAVTVRKQRRIVLAARRFLRHHLPGRQRSRFDVVTVRLRGGRAHVRWIRDAFRA